MIWLGEPISASQHDYMATWQPGAKVIAAKAQETDGNDPFI